MSDVYEVHIRSSDCGVPSELPQPFKVHPDSGDTVSDSDVFPVFKFLTYFWRRLSCSWQVTGAGRLREEGEIKLDEEIEKVDGPDEVFDGSGNKIEVKRAMTDPKEIKKAIKEIEKKVSANKKNNTLTEEETWEITDKLAELKAALEAQKK